MSLEDPRGLWVLLALALMAPAFFFSRRAIRASTGAVMAVLRTLVVLCLALALASLLWKREINQSAVMILTDISDSLDKAELSRRDEFLKQALATTGNNRVAGVIHFGASPVTSALPSASPKLTPPQGAQTSETDIEAALRQAMLYLPATGRRRVVLLSDGMQTRGDALAAARTLAASGIEISTLSLASNRAADVSLAGMSAPPRRKLKEPIRLSVQLDAEEAQEGTLRIYEDGQPIAAERVQLKPGVTQVQITRDADSSGFHTYEAVYENPSDAHLANNRAGAFTYVEGPDRVLVAQGEGGGPGSPLVRSLKGQGLEVVATHMAAPIRAEDLIRYDSVVLDNLPATLLSQTQMGLMRDMVHGLGRGLVMVGGKDSFGPGGYYGTPIEKALPVDMRLMTRRNLPSLAIVFAIDKSGSMADFDTAGEEKIALARESIALALDLVLPGDLVGVVGFDSAAKWVVPLSPLKKRDAAKDQVRSLAAGGGTDMYPAVKEAFDALVSAPAMYKHLIVLSDGMTNPADFENLIANYRKRKITVTAVGVGSDADREFLTWLADAGNGRVYFPASASNLPQLYTRETTLAYRAYLVQEPFTPRRVQGHAILNGINALPQLEGYVGASPKPTAQHLLVSHKKDPLLSAWQHGLGRTAAFTSDSGGRWAKGWLAWDGFSPFFAQMIRWTSGGGARGAAKLSVHHQNATEAEVIAEIEDEDGRPPLQQTVELTAIDPQGKSRTLTLHRQSPGRYSGRLRNPSEGVYIGRVGGGKGEISAVTGAYLGGGAEYAHRLPEESILGQLAAMTGGRELSTPEELWENIAHSRPQETPLQNWLILIAALLFLVDVALRRFNLSSKALAEVVKSTAGEAAKVVAAAPTAPLTPQPRTMETLLKQKQATAERESRRAGLMGSAED